MKSKLLLFLLLFNFSLASNAQSREDLVECLKLVFNHPEMEPVYQHDISEGRAAIIRSFLDREKNINPRPLARLLRDLSDDDFWGTERPIKVMRSDEIEFHGIHAPYLVSFGISGHDDELTFMMTTNLKEQIKHFQASFLLKKNNNKWEIVSHSINLR